MHMYLLLDLELDLGNYLEIVVYVNTGNYSTEWYSV